MVNGSGAAGVGGIGAEDGVHGAAAAEDGVHGAAGGEDGVHGVAAADARVGQASTAPWDGVPAGGAAGGSRCCGGLCMAALSRHPVPASPPRWADRFLRRPRLPALALRGLHGTG